MKQKKVCLTSGCPGCGKSTWIRANLTKGCEWVSRDNVRFALLKDGEDYFAHEDEVFEKFIDYINEALEDDAIHTIYVDATHLSKKSRRQVLTRLNRKLITELNCYCFTTPFDVCLERNAKREGRARVPNPVIGRMYQSATLPDATEGFDHVYCVDQNGEVKEVNV